MWLSDLWNKVKDYFSSKPSSEELHRSKKKFIVHSNPTSQSSSHMIRRGSTKMRVHSESRPRKCPRCLSEKTIIKLEGGRFKWECSVSKNGCGYKW